jgi:hypothetical protein
VLWGGISEKTWIQNLALSLSPFSNYTSTGAALPFNLDRARRLALDQVLHLSQED